MTAASPHRVRRQTWRLRVGSAPAAFAERARFRAAVEDLLPAFARAFDAWAPGDAMLRIPRLEMSLQVRSLDELARKLDEALAEALRREASAAPAPSPAADRLRVLLRYLETGLLEWHAAHAEPAAAAAALRETLLGALLAVVRAAPAGAAAFEAAAHYWIRMLQLLPEERWPEAAMLLEKSAAPGPLPARMDLVAAVRSVVAARERLGERAALALAAAVFARGRVPAIAPERLRQALARLAGTSAPIQAPQPAARLLVARAADIPARSGDAPSAPAPTRARRPLETRVDGAAQPRPLPVMADNAGLVLLHPFLPRLLEACDLYVPGERLAPHSLPRAAALLHWLARGGDEPHEFELAAVKLVLGMRPDDPLAVGAGLLGDCEREEGHALLAAAVAHWKALGGTSVDGLRVAFLQRRAALREEEDGWRLQPERESFDVLLDRLPWTLSTVKLPWMTRPLYTDWPTR